MMEDDIIIDEQNLQTKKTNNNSNQDTDMVKLSLYSIQSHNT